MNQNKIIKAINMIETIDGFTSDNVDSLKFLYRENFEFLFENRLFNEAKNFCRNQLQVFLTTEECENLLTKINFLEFKTLFIAIYNQSLEFSRKNEMTKALYFEYYYDGHSDVSNGNMYLCDDYDVDDDDYFWASSFHNVIGSISVCPYFDPIYNLFNNDKQTNVKCKIHFSTYFIHMLLIINAFQAIYDKQEALIYPFAFDGHDYGQAYTYPKE